MINVVDSTGRVYAGVQKQIWSAIAAHLPAGSWTTSPEYVEGALNFSLFIDQDSDVMMSHGAADKNYLWRKTEDGRRVLTQGHRTHVLVPGPFLQRRVREAPELAMLPANVHSVGWPRLDLLLAEQNGLLARARRRMRRRPRVLWAPTHDRVRRGKRQLPLSSYPAFVPYVEKLRSFCDVQVSEHPRNRPKGAHRRPTTDLLVEADVVISDFGTMVYEAWALEKQVIFPNWLIGRRLERAHKGAAENVIFNERIGLHPGSFDELVTMIQERTQPDAQHRAFLDDYLDPRYLGTSGKRIADLLVRLEAEAPHANPPVSAPRTPLPTTTTPRC